MLHEALWLGDRWTHAVPSRLDTLLTPIAQALLQPSKERLTDRE